VTDAYVPLTGPPAWQHAACRGEDPELWFPIGPMLTNPDGETAEDICRRCQYAGDRGECADWARQIQVTAGIWGGVDMAHKDNQRIRPQCALNGCGNRVGRGRVKYCSQFCQHEADRRNTLERERRKRHEQRQEVLQKLVTKW
jgi:WhiB family redox-sensing transcriptional regulator